MKINLKALILVFRPRLVKQALKNLWEIVEFNLSEEKNPGLTEAMNFYVSKEGIPAFARLCFQWIVEEILPRWSRELTEGHALALSECEWNGVHEE